MSTVKIATCAFPGTHDIAENVRRHLSFIDEATQLGASLVVFPETSLHGYPGEPGAGPAETQLTEMQAAAEPVPHGPNVARLVEAAQAHGVHVVFGVIEATDDPAVMYNTLVLAGPGGYVGKFRKVHLAITEHLFWRPGDDWPVFDTPIGRIGMLICYDKSFPESARELALGGADVLVMGTAWCSMPGHSAGETNPWVRQYELFDRARAAENGRWFVSSNLVGDLGGMDFFGLSQVVDPLGEVVASTGIGNKGLAIAEVDIRAGIAKAAAYFQGPFLVRDRRPDTYRRLRGDTSSQALR